MGIGDRFRENAECCLRLAARLNKPEHQQFARELAAMWIALAENAERAKAPAPLPRCQIFPASGAGLVRPQLPHSRLVRIRQIRAGIGGRDQLNHTAPSAWAAPAPAREVSPVDELMEQARQGRSPEEAIKLMQGHVEALEKASKRPMNFKPRYTVDDYREATKRLTDQHAYEELAKEAGHEPTGILAGIVAQRLNSAIDHETPAELAARNEHMTMLKQDERISKVLQDMSRGTTRRLHGRLYVGAPK